MSGQSPVEAGFLWGVATSAYQAEGGYNGEDQPKTNWAKSEREQNVDTLGNAAEFWTRYPQDFALCKQMGLSAFRLGIEWSRVQPTINDLRSDPPGFDFAALDHYARMLAACRDFGLEPILTLHHFVHPAWLGPDPWLNYNVVAYFNAYVSTTVRHINGYLTREGYPPIRYYLTINEPNMLLFNTYLGGQFPSAAPRGFHSAMTACCHLLCAHIEAYNCIHDIYAAEGWARPNVTINNYCSDLYWADKFLLDFLAVAERGIPRSSIPDYVLAKKAAFDSSLRQANIIAIKNLPYWVGALSKQISAWLCERYFSLKVFQPMLDKLYQSPRAEVMDYLAVDYYDPFSAHVFRSPALWDIELSNKSFHSWVMNTISSKWWDWRVLPKGLNFFCRYYSADFDNKPILIAENGMALRRKTDNSASHRRDRISRSQFLSLHVNEVKEIVRLGVPVFGYLHWSLFDNYEWGTYTPRFGLFSLDYQQGAERLAVDHFGDCPSLSYAALIKYEPPATSSP
jgi:beta-glucosidase/6-phospho-beta-glucosidase/beta-galactosidase